jgi:N-acetylmuramoyl-L-alanine amidase
MMKRLALFGLVCLQVLCLTAQIALAQSALTLDLTLSDGRTINDKVQFYTVKNTEMVAIADICHVLRLPFEETPQMLVVATRQHDSCMLRTDNHFAVVWRNSHPKEVMQLPAPPLLQEGKHYLMPKHVGRWLSVWLGAAASYDPTARKLTVVFRTTADSTTKAFSTAGTKPDSSSNPTTPAKSDTTLTSKPDLDERYTVPSLAVDEKANGVIIRIFATQPNVQYEFIPPDANGIAYLTFVKSTGNMAALTQKFPKNNFLRSIQAIRLKSGALQLTFEFNVARYKIKSSEFARERGSNNFLMLILRDVNVQEILEHEKVERVKSELEQEREKWKLDVICLDAGHGGKDPGAIGASGTYEKTVALGIVLKLGKLIEKNMPDVKVIYTRKSDVFVELDERGRIANKNGAKLFVSVHCNASLNKKAEGTEVYLLGLHKTEAALKVAQRENAVIAQESDYQDRYKDYTDENLIMVTMAQSAFMQQSEKLAELVSRNIAAHSGLQNNGVKQAGFMVLWTPSMPSILVETGYITHAENEKFLVSESGQQKIAEAIYEAIVKFQYQYHAQR